jgi:hypothetical protein
MFTANDGVIYRSSKDGNNVGKWRILSDGKFCRAWWERQQERCYVVYQEGETLELYPTDRMGKGLGQTCARQSGGLLKSRSLVTEAARHR